MYISFVIDTKQKEENSAIFQRSSRGEKSI